MGALASPILRLALFKYISSLNEEKTERREDGIG